jgi:hypothetical protein
MTSDRPAILLLVSCVRVTCVRARLSEHSAPPAYAGTDNRFVSSPNCRRGISRRQSGRRIKNKVAGLRMTGALPLLPLYTFVARASSTHPLHLYTSIRAQLPTPPDCLLCSHKKHLSTTAKNRPQVSNSAAHFNYNTKTNTTHKCHVLTIIFQNVNEMDEPQTHQQGILGSRPDWQCGCTSTPVTLVQVKKGERKVMRAHRGWRHSATHSWPRQWVPMGG